ncbi:hypothetical protein [Actinomadura rubrisoli]|uniref:Uncharacterized protein n=1 Tax=Actinomadura rubrisoli TaxID=2530368 RepID=A0A4R5CFD7_9ACTN|nr:hypothetical protein [Actinomadura rubrisoli]TDD97676.1 hypothetical protein E1298_01175 [Actinomadura rubrisoli]
MKIEIEFRPANGPAQTLYADLPPRDVEQLEADTTNPDRADDVVYIPSRVKKDGPTNEWMFRIGRIKIHRVS